MPALDNINRYLLEGKTEDALEELLAWCDQNFPEKSKEVILQITRFKQAKNKFIKGLMTSEEYQVLHQNVNLAIQLILEECKTNSNHIKEESKPALHEYHSYTCDRVDQSDTFKQLFKGASGRKAQFYYLYGGDMQSHEGMFRRIAYDLEGRLLDHLNPDLESSRQAKQIELTFELSNNLDIYKENILKSFFAALNIPVNEQEPLLERTIQDVCAKSPIAKGLSANDYICTYIHISEYDWNPKLTTTAARWFIREFCQPQLPDNAPSFLFFFAIEYDEENEDIIAEVKDIVHKSDKIKALPELGMVHNRDIGKWFETYKRIAPTTRDRKKMIKEKFGAGSEHYMEDIEIHLQRIIDEYNKRNR